MESFTTLEGLYTSAQTRALDRAAIDGVDNSEPGVPGIQLMSRAGRACFRILCETWQDVSAITVFCGTGNNGGDGYVIAALARERGMDVTVFQLGDESKITGDALTARTHAVQAGVEITPFDAAASPGEGVIVDAMLGTGLGGDVRAPYSEAIAAINGSGLPVLAVDIPSGLCADSGRVFGCAVSAQVTVTFIGLKRGLFTGQGPDYAGQLEFYDLGVSPGVYAQVPTSVYRLELETCLQWLPERSPTTHKGDCGSVLVVGGDRGMGGALLMAAEAAARAGAGLVSAATRPGHVAAVLARRPEVMAVGVESGQELEPLLARADVVVVGPGLGRSAWSEQMMYWVCQSGLPLVLDADALNILADRPESCFGPEGLRVLTPHPGEAARLLGCDTAEVQQDRFAAVEDICDSFHCITLLKGAGTLASDGGQILVSDYGNPGMASGGMGDVLAGLIGGLLAQDLPALQAAALGAVAHGAAADIAAEQGQRGMLATDLFSPLRQLLE